MPVYNGNNPMELCHLIRQDYETGFIATGYQPLITGLLATGDDADFLVLKNHVARAYFRKLDEVNLNSYITDNYDSGFRPETVTGLYS